MIGNLVKLVTRLFRRQRAPSGTRLSLLSQRGAETTEWRPQSPPRCHYCANTATKTLVWLKDKRGMPAAIKLPWCGCDLMQALRRFWPDPYQVHEGFDYEVRPLER